MAFRVSMENMLLEEAVARERISKKEKELNIILNEMGSPLAKTQQSKELIKKYSPRKGDSPGNGKAFFNEGSSGGGGGKKKQEALDGNWLESLYVCSLAYHFAIIIRGHFFFMSMAFLLVLLSHPSIYPS